jgi:cell volume regulation protein A
MNLYLLAGAAIVFVSILLTPISTRIGAPLLLLFLLLGMLVGEDGPGDFHFEDFSLAYNIGSVALALILFSGGLDTSPREIRTAAVPAFLLATLGVVLTAAGVGTVAVWLFDMPLAMGLLLGSVVASTDAAATFLMLQQSGIRLRGRIRETILVESGINDPMAIFLTTVLVMLVDSGTELSWAVLPDLLPDLALQLGLGLLAGLAGGRLLSWLIDRFTLPTGLYPPFALTGGLIIFSATQLAGGSGFLAIYLCGIMITATLRQPLERKERITHFHEGLAWLSQIVMFLMLGVLVTPHELADSLLVALVFALVLMFVIRPLAVFLCLSPLRFNWRDQLFIGWVGLRGAVPIFLAIIPVISPGPVTAVFFNVVFVIVICSLLLQGWTISTVARRLGVALPKPTALNSASK